MQFLIHPYYLLWINIVLHIIRFYSAPLITELLVICSGGNVMHTLRRESHEIFKNITDLKHFYFLPILAKSFSNFPAKEGSGIKSWDTWWKAMGPRSTGFLSIHHCRPCKFDCVEISYSLNLILASKRNGFIFYYLFFLRSRVKVRSYITMART